MTVYVVTCGEGGYDSTGYTVRGVFTNKEKAHEFGEVLRQTFISHGINEWADIQVLEFEVTE